MSHGALIIEVSVRLLLEILSPIVLIDDDNYSIVTRTDLIVKL